MNQTEWSYAWVAIIIAFVVLRGLVRMIRGRAGNQMDRINAAAKRVLEEQQQAGRTSVPVTQNKGAIGTAAKAKQRPVRTAATAQKPRAAGVALANVRSPAVVRTGILSGSKEPVIQRRR